MLSAVIASARSYPAMRLASQPVHQRYVHSGPLVLGAAPVKSPAPTADRDQTVSRRFEPSSRTSLNGEQPYPWDRLQPQDEMSRHRGAKHRRRYELLGGISLLSPEYLLSVERWPFHTEPPDHYVLLSYLLDLSVSQSSALVPLHFSSAISDRAKRTFELLRYLLGGDRPSQTAHHALSPPPIQGARLEPQRCQAGISTLAPRELASTLQSLPAILHKHRHSPMQSYSKGSWGLSVLPRGDCIITNTSTSLSLWRRQCGHHYAIRAGRNLPDKEFRYLRTVIVTAAVYWDFNQELAPHHLIFQHRAGVRPYTSTFVLAESCVFGKQLQPPILCDLSSLTPQGLHNKRHTFSRSYGINLPSSFSRVLSSALEFSSYPPVSVCGTVNC